MLRDSSDKEKTLISKGKSAFINGGLWGARTLDNLVVTQVLSQLS